MPVTALKMRWLCSVFLLLMQYWCRYRCMQKGKSQLWEWVMGNEFFPFLGKQLKQYVEGELQGEISRVPEPCGCNRLGSSYDGQRRAVNTWLPSLTVTGNLAVWSCPVTSASPALSWNAASYVCHGLLESLIKVSNCLSCKISNG